MTEFADVFVTPEDIDEANKASSFLFTVPPDAVRKGNPEKSGGAATWSQTFSISAVTLEHGEIKDKTGTYTGLTAQIEFTVPPGSERQLATGEMVADPNAGRSLRQWYKLVDGAQGNKEHKKYKAFYFNLGRLKALLASAGWQVPGAGFSLKQYFGSDILIGATVNTLMKRDWYEGKPKDEISDFIAPEIASA